jgi:hypothetical protein
MYALSSFNPSLEPYLFQTSFHTDSLLECVLVDVLRAEGSEERNVNLDHLNRLDGSSVVVSTSDSGLDGVY